MTARRCSRRGRGGDREAVGLGALLVAGNGLLPRSGPEVGLLAPSLGGYRRRLRPPRSGGGSQARARRRLIFGGAILVAHQIHGAEAKADLPDPAILLIVITTVLAVGFGALGNWLRERAT